MKKHQKHIKLTRVNNDILAPNEISILGVKCSIISDLIFDISESFGKKYNIAYVDASHNEKSTEPMFDTFTFNLTGELEINKSARLNKFNERIRYSQYDLTIINGNHFEGENQIVVLDKDKEKSIQKRINQINNILFFVKKDADAFVFDCLKEKFENINDIPVFELDEIENITNEIEKQIEKNKPILKGLVLVGGKSTRMGIDKAKLKYYGKEHSLFLAELLQNKRIETFLSVKDQIESNFPQIKDRFLDLGPFGAICSAFMSNPNQAYFVLATDLPFVDDDLLSLVLKNRDTSKVATTVKGKLKEFPEPLITIWEPKAYPILLSYLSQGITCPRKVLINSDINIIEIDDKFITNVNTKQEFESIKTKLI